MHDHNHNHDFAFIRAMFDVSVFFAICQSAFFSVMIFTALSQLIGDEKHDHTSIFSMFPCAARSGPFTTRRHTFSGTKTSADCCHDRVYI